LAAFELAAHGGGVALGRKSLAGHAVASGRLVAPFGLAVPINEAFHLFQPAGSSSHPDAEVFLDWLLATAGTVEGAGHP
jgi:LysR family glycine cleavage system transcriptional activator